MDNDIHKAKLFKIVRKISGKQKVEKKLQNKIRNHETFHQF